MDFCNKGGIFILDLLIKNVLSIPNISNNNLNAATSAHDYILFFSLRNFVPEVYSFHCRIDAFLRINSNQSTQQTGGLLLCNVLFFRNVKLPINCGKWLIFLNELRRNILIQVVAKWFRKKLKNEWFEKKMIKLFILIFTFCIKHKIITSYLKNRKCSTYSMINAIFQNMHESMSL